MFDGQLCITCSASSLFDTTNAIAFLLFWQTPSREFLLRVSYLEIYNEVIMLSSSADTVWHWSETIIVHDSENASLLM